MKRLYIILSLILVCSSFTQAQEKRREEIEAFRVAYFTRQLNLTADEAKKFWPVFNEMQTEMQKIQKDKRARHRTIKQGMESLSDAELEKMINDEMAAKQKELDIEKKYHEKFKDILPMQKLALYYRAQDGFKRELLRKLQDQHKAKDAN